MMTEVKDDSLDRLNYNQIYDHTQIVSKVAKKSEKKKDILL